MIRGFELRLRARTIAFVLQFVAVCGVVFIILHGGH